MVSGVIISYTGPMCSGKSLELVKIAELEEIKGRKVAIIKPNIDFRDENYIKSRLGPTRKVNYFYNNSKEILDYARNYDSIIIDEAQFSDENLSKIVEELKREGKNIYLAYLNQSFRGEPFNELVKDLLFISDKVYVLKAVCDTCGKDASRTQRLIDGKPANYNDPLVVIGYQQYVPRCRRDHVVYDKPQNFDLDGIDLNKEGKIVAYHNREENDIGSLVSYLINSRKLDKAPIYWNMKPDILLEEIRKNKQRDKFILVLEDRIDEKYAKFIDELATRGYNAYIIGKEAMREILPYADYIIKVPDQLLP